MEKPRPALSIATSDGAPRPKRRLADWIDGFNQYTSKFGSPSIYCHWTGLVTLAGALERKVWTTTNKGRLHPNLYVFIVGPPGAGKTVPIDEAGLQLFTQLREHKVAATNVSGASLIDDLAGSQRHKLTVNGGETFNAMTIFSNELQVILPAYDSDFMGKLTDFYDGRRYEEKKRSRELHITMEKPCLNIIAATTPSYLQGLLPEGAWDQGFMSRSICVYSGGVEEFPDLWEEREANETLFHDLVHDLRAIGDLSGEVTMTQEVRDAFLAWARAGGKPKPDHPNLIHYNTRRPAHLLKLSMISSVSRDNDLIVTIDDYRNALNWLVAAESAMPDIFKAMTQGGAKRIMDEAWHFATHIYMKSQQPVPEQKIVLFLSERLPGNMIGPILDAMVRGGILKECVPIPGVGKAYEPKPRKA